MGEITGVLHLVTLIKLPLSETVSAHGLSQRFTASAGTNGHFALRLPPGTYVLSGRSPQFENGTLACGDNPVTVAAGRTYTSNVFCQGF